MPELGRLIACDMDGTVIPLENGPEHRRHVEAFRAAVERAEGVRLAYVTGRHFPHALQGIEEHGLPAPDYLSCEVGTSIRVRDGADYRVDEAYRAAMADALGADMDALRAVLRDAPGLTLQPEGEQGEFKASFDTSWPVPPALLADMEERIAGAGAKVSVVVSRHVGGGHGLVDVLPAGVAKDRAVRHLAEREGLPPERVIYAGDSGNDLAALVSGVQGIVVGNAPDPLVEEIRRQAAERGLEERVHFARGRYAAGVLEGCRHFGVL